MKIIFMGTPEFARANLIALCESRHQLLAIVTGPDSKAGRGREMIPSVCRVEAEGRDLPVHMPDSLKSKALLETLGEYDADLFVVAAFRILPRRLYELPRLGSINIHGSLLPKYRGAAPINWAIINGEKETGLTSFFLADKVDSGDIILQSRIAIEDDDNFDSLHERLMARTSSFLLETLEAIEKGNKTAVPQDDNLSSPARKLFTEDAKIDFNMPVARVRNFIRGMSTRPGAYTYCREKKLKIHACAPVPEYEGTKVSAGEITEDRKRFIVWCADGPLELTRVVPQGKNEMDGSAFLNGLRPASKEKLGEV